MFSNVFYHPGERCRVGQRPDTRRADTDLPAIPPKFAQRERPNNINQFAGTDNQAASGANQRNFPPYASIAAANLPSLLAVKDQLKPWTSDDQAIHWHLSEE